MPIWLKGFSLPARELLQRETFREGEYALEVINFSSQRSSEIFDRSERLHNGNCLSTASQVVRKGLNAGDRVEY